jgi:hypothetical protein
MPRAIAILGFMAIGGILGFFCVSFLAERLLPLPKGPAPYGNWRASGAGVILGTPIGAAFGFVFGFFVTRTTKDELRSRNQWNRLTWLGAMSGIAIGYLSIELPIFELFDNIGELIGSVWIGRCFYFVISCAIGVVAFELGAATVRLIRR